MATLKDLLENEAKTVYSRVIVFSDFSFSSLADKVNKFMEQCSHDYGIICGPVSMV